MNEAPKTVYFVGDTPESDIRGTNEFDQISDESWFSILVKTGVYQEGTIPRFPPKKTCGNVLEAVKFAVEREVGRNAHSANEVHVNGKTNGFVENGTVEKN